VSAPYRLYDEFAEFYNRYWGDYFLEDAQEGIANVLLPRLPYGGRVLDLCCGTGQTSAWLGACGFDVVGLDASPRMLEFAAVNAPTAELLCADARDFHLRDPVDGVLATFDSINHFATMDEVARVFGCVFEALRPGGWFLFDFNSDEGFAYNAGETYSVCEDDHAGIVRSEYDQAAGRGLSRITLFNAAEGGLWSRKDLEIPEYCHPTEELEGALRQAGFDSRELFDATEDFEMPKAEGRFFLLAQRPE
jgi:SAM-dependent methyltransferase